MFDEFGPWRTIKDGDARAYALFERHYSMRQYKDNRRQSTRLIAGPGERLMLITGDCQALFIWKDFNNPAGEEGLYCSLFHNESNYLASYLILEAEKLAQLKWPNVNRFYTYINSKKVKPIRCRGRELWGYCFLKAGWQQCNYITKWNKHLVFEKQLSQVKALNPSPIQLGHNQS